jgi:hypothetical protein
MTAEIFQIRDYQHPREICRSNERLERLAIENAVFPEATRSQGIDGMVQSATESAEAPIGHPTAEIAG